jgi:hypothetical protein
MKGKKMNRLQSKLIGVQIANQTFTRERPKASFKDAALGIILGAIFTLSVFYICFL